MHYYNEIDLNAAQWIRELIKNGLIPAGEVDTRSIEDIAARELAPFTQCHFFAGIGGWAYALQLAQWPVDRHVWTGSCPCQPFSAAGKNAGFTDERHLWPAWFHLIAQCRPPVIFGEQVASKAGLTWLDLIYDDLQAAGYAVGATDTSAASTGAPHIRQRLYFVGVADSARLQRWRKHWDSGNQSTIGSASVVGVVAYSDGRDTRTQWKQRVGEHGQQPTNSAANPVEHASGEQMGLPGCTRIARGTAWANAQWIECTDGKVRPIESGTFPLAHGVSGRMGLLRGYGNAIVPQ